MNAEDLHERMIVAQEPMTDEELDLVIRQIQLDVAKLSRMCNFILNRPGGISLYAVDTIAEIKHHALTLKFFTERRLLRPDADTKVLQCSCQPQVTADGTA